MLTSQFSAQPKQSKWKSISKNKNSKLYNSQTVTQQFSKFTPKSSKSKSKQKNFISKISQKNSQFQTERNSRIKEEVECIPALKFRKQYQQDKVNECNSCRLEKKNAQGPLSSELQSQREQIVNADISRIGLQTNKSIVASSESRKNFYQFFNIQERQVLISKQFSEVRGLFLAFRRYFQQQLQKMQVQFYRNIHMIKKKYEAEINILKAKLEHHKKQSNEQKTQKDDLLKKRLRFQDGRLNSKIGTIVKCKNKTIPNTEQQKKSKSLYSKAQKTLKEQQQEKLKRQKSFEKIFETIQILKQSVDKNPNITSDVQNQISQSEQNLIENQWGLYSFKMAGQGVPLALCLSNKFQANQMNKKSLNGLKIQNSQVKQQQQFAAGIMSNVTELSNCSGVHNLNSPQLYASVATACFDMYDKEMKQNRF